MALYGNCDGLCAPTIIYLILMGVSLLSQFLNYFVMENPYYSHLSNATKIKALLGSLVSSGIFAWILYIICSHCHPGISWFLLLLPIFIMVVIMFMLAGYIHEMDQN